MLLEKQDTQFRALIETLKDLLYNLGSSLDSSVSKLSKSIDEKIDKLNSVHTSEQPGYLNREWQEPDTPSSNTNRKKGVGPEKLSGNPNNKRIISQDDNFLSLFAPSDVKDDLQQEADDPLRKVMFVVNDTKLQSESHTEEVRC